PPAPLWTRGALGALRGQPDGGCRGGRGAHRQRSAFPHGRAGGGGRGERHRLVRAVDSLSNGQGTRGDRVVPVLELVLEGVGSRRVAGHRGPEPPRARRDRDLLSPLTKRSLLRVGRALGAVFEARRSG